MHLSVILRTTGALLMMFSPALLMPVLVAALYGEETASIFVTAFTVAFAAGLGLWVLQPGRISPGDGDGFLITVLAYTVLGLVSALPFYLSEHLALGFGEAAFESFSGLTTTGATGLSGLEMLPRSILFYRQWLQWLGGMGIIVLAVAVLPLLGIGGMQLYQAEMAGPLKDRKLTPRIAETAKALWYLYLGLTLLCAGAYWLAGMSPFDAICHAFSTIAIGGFSTYDASIAHFDSVAVETVAIAFMVFAGINFGLHFTVWRRRSLGYYSRDPEVRLYFGVLLAVSVLTFLLLSHTGSGEPEPLRASVFQAVSIATTSGFTSADFSQWPSAAPVLLMMAAFVGGCAGSTAGGLKIVRVLLIYRLCAREIKRLIHPLGVFPLKLGQAEVPVRVADAVWSFCLAYFSLFLLLGCLVMGISDLDLITAFSAVGACLTNLGPGLGDVAANYEGLPAAVTWILIFAMVLGRLEVFTLLVILSAAFWKR